MYILYEPDGQTIIHHTETSREMGEYLGVDAAAVRRLTQSHRKKASNPSYVPRKPFVVHEETEGRVDKDELIRMAREGYSAWQIARHMRVSRPHITNLLGILADEIGPVSGCTDKNVKPYIRPEFIREWSAATARLRQSGCDLSRIRIVKEEK